MKVFSKPPTSLLAASFLLNPDQYRLLEISKLFMLADQQSKWLSDTGDSHAATEQFYIVNSNKQNLNPVLLL